MNEPWTDFAMQGNLLFSQRRFLGGTLRAHIEGGTHFGQEVGTRGEQLLSSKLQKPKVRRAELARHS